jgi:hypothetical protein
MDLDTDGYPGRASINIRSGQRCASSARRNGMAAQVDLLVKDEDLCMVVEAKKAKMS